MRASVKTGLVLASLLALAPSARADVGCAREIGSTAAFVESLKDLFGRSTSGRSPRVALGGTIDPDVLAQNARSLSPAERTRLAREMLGVLVDPALAKAATCEEKRVRYNALATLVQLVKNAPKAERASLFDCLLEAARVERDPALRRQMEIDLDRLAGSASPASRKEAAALVEEVLPPSPPYESIFGADGKRTDVNMVIHAGAETFRAPYAGAFRRAGAKITKHTPTDWTIDYTVTPDDPTGKLAPVTFHIRLVDHWKDDFANLDVFRNMDKADPQIEMFDFHSQYGNALDESMEDAKTNAGAKKLFILAACKSKVFASRAAAKYPKTQFVTTRDGEYFSDTPPMVVKMLTNIANRATWAQLNRELVANDLTNYHLPNDRAQREYVDSDADGIADEYDEALTCGLKKVAAKNTFAPAVAAGDRLTLQGEKVLHAVTVANGLIGYNPAVVRWEDTFVSDGWGPADPAGPLVTFTPAKNAKGRNITKVRVNAAYSHLSDLALATALTREATLYASSNGRPETATIEAKIRAFETATDLISAWDPDGVIWDAFQAEYNLGKDLTFSFATNALDHDDGANAETIAKVKRFLDRGRP